MRIIFCYLIFASFVWSVAYNVIPAETRSNRSYSQTNKGKINPKVIPPQSNQAYRQKNLGVQIRQSSKTSQYGTQKQMLPIQISRQNTSFGSKNIEDPNIVVIPPSSQSSLQKQNGFNIKIYPPTIGSDSKTNPNTIHPNIDPSRPINQDMMFEKTKPYKMKIPPPRRRVVQVQPQYVATPQAVDEYEGEDNEPLFIRNRNGVMLGFGIGGSFDRLWVSGSGGNARFYDSAFSYYFRLGYQYYFTHYLGVRVYANLGDWSNNFYEDFFDGERNSYVNAKVNFNYSFFAEVLYDFIVLQNHSFGIFGGFGIGVSYGEFSNDGTEVIGEYFAMPAISAGFAYTLFENNRFEFETKIPLKSEVLKKQWRAELSTWMIGVSYTYIF